MNCAFVASYYGPYYSNFVASILAFHEKMHSQGHEICYIFPKEVATFDWIKLLKLKTERIFFVKYEGTSWNNIFELRKIFKQQRVNLIYSHMCGWDFAAHFAAPLTPIVWHMRMGVNLKPFSKKIKNLLKFHILGFGKTYHVAVSVAVTDIINSLHPHNKCIAIPNALDISRLPHAFINFPKNKIFRLLMFGWQPYTKGLDTVLEACEKMNEQEETIELLVSSQKKTYEFIKERYQDKNPIWLKLLPPTNDVASLYVQADMMVSASRSEGFSFCLAEALYCGLPVIYSDIPGTSWAGEFKCAHIFKTADSIDLYRAIRECMKKGITKEQQIANRELLEKKYSLNTWTDRVVNFLESIPLVK